MRTTGKDPGKSGSKSWEGGAGVPGASARVRTDTGRSAHFLENKAVKSRLSQSSLGVRVPVCVLSPFSRVRLFVTPWIVALQAALSMGFSRQGYWSGLPCPPPGNHPNPGIKSASLTLAGEFFTPEPPGKSFILMRISKTLVYNCQLRC